MTIWPEGHVASRIVVPASRGMRLLAIVAAGAALVSIALAPIAVSLALFTAHADPQAVFGTKALFPGERVTPAFVVGDASSGSQVDRSSSFAAAADGLTTTTSAWSTAYAAGRYLEFDLNSSLAAGVAVTTATFDFRFASSGAGQACYYFEVRRISTGAVIGTYGSSGAPVGCVTGTSQASFSTSIASSLTTTSVANDLRVRAFGKETGSGAMVIDRATVGGSTPYQSFTLYPVMFRDAADTTPELIPWGLDVP
ncbi:MAG: hypothetical protein H0V73_05920 [Chloroflexi bacterium]|nr:hypothetical protein [Chloroflexota bacterium]